MIDGHCQVNNGCRTAVRSSSAAPSAERKKIETLFGEVKHILALTQLRLRGLTGARDEFLITATVQNLNCLVNNTTIPPPKANAA